MKKFVCLLISLVLCLSCAALAASVPSKTTGDMASIEVSAENMPMDSGFFIQPVAADDPVYQAKLEICQNEIKALAESKSVEEYFGEVVNAEGEAVDLAEVLGSETLNVHEFCPLVVGEYEESYGKVIAKMVFATPYAAGEEVIVLIGVAAEGKAIEWTAFEGVGVESEGVFAQGCIQVEFDAETIMAVQEGNALMAVVSK